MRVLHWFRKDLRVTDNTALAAAFADSGGDVVVCYVSEPAVLRRPDIAACRVRFVLDSLRALAAHVRRLGGRLVVRHGDAALEVARIARETGATTVYWNCEYEPQRIARDRNVKDALDRCGIRVRAFHDRLLVAPGAVATKDENPYTVFTPFERACRDVAVGEPRPAVPRLADPGKIDSLPLATAEELGFHTIIKTPPAGETNAIKRLERFCDSGLKDYASARDFLAEQGTSRLSADLNFGTISPRTVYWRVQEAAAADPGLRASAQKFASELRWRDFYAHILYQFPRVEAHPFKEACENVRWEESEDGLQKWRDGQTGYPVVDAAMRQLRATGWMHNRARMIAASFFTKDLGLDWRLGERHFMKELLDGDLASNNGGWQWSASTGTDAQPWFRIFNPVLQGMKFDPHGKYVKTWCPELSRIPENHVHAPWEAPPDVLAAAGVRLGGDYPRPCVDHSMARVRAIARFEAAVKSGSGRPGNRK